MSKFLNVDLSDPLSAVIILEAGINHNGSFKIAKKMVEAAKDLGADAIKFQTFKAKEFVSSREQLFTYYSQGKKVTESMLDMFEKYELNESDWKGIADHCKRVGVKFLSTPQNLSDLQLLMPLGLDVIKVGSDDLNNLPLLKSYSHYGKPIILSIGMTDIGELQNSLTEVGFFEGAPIAVLVCTSIYPAPKDTVNIRRVQTLKNLYPGLIVGFSDHTEGSAAAIMAASLGAQVFEKHFTLDKNLPGPDHWFSEDIDGARSWIDSIFMAKDMLGDGIIRPATAEHENKKAFQRVLVAKREIKPGEIFSDLNLGAKRSSEARGWSVKYFHEFLGRSATRYYAKDEVIDI